jgi:hypothetical protein
VSGESANNGESLASAYISGTLKVDNIRLTRKSCSAYSNTI